jgi:hypothetical protein
MYVCRSVTEFIDGIFRENAWRALARDAPVSAREAKERWNNQQEKRAAFFVRPGARQDCGKSDGWKTDGYRQDSGRGRGGNRGRGGGKMMPRAGVQQRGKGAQLNGDNVCYHYNQALGCSRTLKGSGCDNGGGGVYAHACNFEISTGVFCLSKHPRAGNH